MQWRRNWCGCLLLSRGLQSGTRRSDGSSHHHVVCGVLYELWEELCHRSEWFPVEERKPLDA